MQTINLQISLVPTAPAAKEKPKSYQIGYDLGKIFGDHKNKKIAQKVEKILDIKWSKDYSEFEHPTVFRKEKHG